MRSRLMILALLICVVTTSCRRKTSMAAEQTSTATATMTVTGTLAADQRDTTVATMAETATEVAHEEQTATESGTITITRDTCGRSTEVRWLRSGAMTARSGKTTRGDRWFHGMNATRYSEAAADSAQTTTTASATAKKEEREPADITDATVWLLKVAGVFALLALVWFLIQEVILPWRQKRQ